MIRRIDLAHRLWFEEAQMLLGQQSIALVAHGERARRIRHYLFTLEQQPRSFLRRLIASLGHDRRFRRGSYERRTSLRRAT